MNDLISKRAVFAKINLWANGELSTDKLIESIKKMSGGSLTDRPCEYCKNHVDGMCAAWDCAFDDVLSSSEKPKSEWQQDHEILKAYSDGANEVLDKIKNEIEQTEINGHIRDVECFRAGIDVALNVIDKYRTERGDKE